MLAGLTQESCRGDNLQYGFKDSKTRPKVEPLTNDFIVPTLAHCKVDQRHMEALECHFDLRYDYRMNR